MNSTKISPTKNKTRNNRQKNKPQPFMPVLLIAVISALIISSIIICIIAASGEKKEEETTLPVTEITESKLDLSSLPESIVNLYNNNPEAKDYVLSFGSEHDKEHKIDLTAYLGTDEVPLFLQWDKSWGYLKYAGDYVALTGCGPTCLSMVAFYLTQDVNMSVKYMIDFATENGYYADGGGSLWTLFSRGAKKLGFTVQEVGLDENLIKKHLNEGRPIICSVGPGDFTTSGHYIVFRKYAHGKIYVNDPNSLINSEKGWSYGDIKEQIRNMWAISL